MGNKAFRYVKISIIFKMTQAPNKLHIWNKNK